MTTFAATSKAAEKEVSYLLYLRKGLRMYGLSIEKRLFMRKNTKESMFWPIKPHHKLAKDQNQGNLRAQQRLESGFTVISPGYSDFNVIKVKLNGGTS